MEWSMKFFGVWLAPMLLLASVAGGAPSIHSEACARFMASVDSIPSADSFPQGPIRSEFLVRARLMLWYERAASQEARIAGGISLANRAVQTLGVTSVDVASLIVRRTSRGDTQAYNSINLFFGHAELITPELLALVSNALQTQLRDTEQRVEYIDGLISLLPIAARKLSEATSDDRARAYEISVQNSEQRYRETFFGSDSELTELITSLEPSTEPGLLQKAKSLLDKRSRLPAYFTEGLATSLEFMEVNPEFLMTKNFQNYVENLWDISRYVGGDPDAGMFE